MLEYIQAMLANPVAGGIARKKSRKLISKAS